MQRRVVLRGAPLHFCVNLEESAYPARLRLKLSCDAIPPRGSTEATATPSSLAARGAGMFGIGCWNLDARETL